MQLSKLHVEQPWVQPGRDEAGREREAETVHSSPSIHSL